MWRASEGRCAAAVVDGGYCARERRTGRIGHDWQGVSLCGMPHGVAVNVTALRASVAISGVFFCLRGSSVLPQPQLPLVAGCALETLGFQNFASPCERDHAHYTAEMLGLFVVAPTAFVAPSRRSSVVPARAAVRLESERPETEMEYLKRRADEKGENGGGWSIFKAKDEDAKPDPPWLVASKARAKQRAERMESTKDTKRPWWKGAEYSDEDSAGLPAAPSVPWFKRMDDSPAEESLAEESSAPAADADAEK